MQVCVPSTPAQVFHMLRRQALRPVRKPLVAMTPKSLLRHKLAVSTLEDLCEGQFYNVIGDVDDTPAQAVDRLVVCSGKVYYDLLEAKHAAQATNIAIIRLEQLYPFPEQEFAEQVSRYTNLTEVIWCQEEPMNQGAWYAMQHRLRQVILAHDDSLYLAYAGREAFAAPAVGYQSLHNEQQTQLVNDALFG
jgi:2-oxoglutarate dehydrogenase E1 component